MDSNIQEEYNEQTLYGNVYNYYIEFLMANPFMDKIVKEDDKASLKMIQIGIDKTFEESIMHIKYENRD